MVGGDIKRQGCGCRTEQRAADKLRPRLLLVDDDEALLKAFSRLFAGRFEVIAVTDPTDALHLLESGVHVDALLTDYVMGSMNGLQLLERVRDAFPKVARFLASGGGLSGEEIERHRQDGLLLAFLPKPLESGAADRFGEHILNMIRRHEQEGSNPVVQPVAR